MVATESQPEAMSSAETVVVLVHGVGDHTHTDILSHLDEALRGTAPHISDVVRLKIPGFPVPNGVSSSQEAMRITIGEGQESRKASRRSCTRVLRRAIVPKPHTNEWWVQPGPR